MKDITLLIENADIVAGAECRRFRGYVAVAGDVVAAVAEGEAPASLREAAAETIDARGRLLLPGVIDTHVHFRDPGMTRKGDFASESAVAVAGGVTSVIDMPNTNPTTVTIGAFEEKMRHAAEVSLCNYGFFIGATNSNIDELRRADWRRVAGVKLFLGSSTGDMLVDRREMLESLFAEIDAPIAVHAESETEIARNRAEIRERFAPGPVPLEFHPVIRSRKACVDASRLAIEMAVNNRRRLHLLHISTADELELLTPGVRRYVTAETCPHYLWFDSRDYARLGTRVKCNPAIKDPADREALLKAVADGRIDTIATDHAPHLPADKEGDALTAASGMPGIRFSLAVMLEIARQQSIPVERIVRMMSVNPARIFSIERRGAIAVGNYADLVLVGTTADGREVTDADAGGKCGWTPYAGSTLHHCVDATIVNGCIEWADGQLTGLRRPMPLAYSR